jgi:hypothetical protein
MRLTGQYANRRLLKCEIVIGSLPSGRPAVSFRPGKLILLPVSSRMDSNYNQPVLGFVLFGPPIISMGYDGIAA